MNEYDHNQLSSRIIYCAIEVHRHLGPGLLESAYQQCLCYEFQKAGIQYTCQSNLALRYKSIEVGKAYKIDLLVENMIVVELKSVDQILDVHKSQLLTYMKIGNYRLGLLLNFNVPLLKQGIIRMAN